jgi:hypothetical protein
METIPHRSFPQEQYTCFGLPLTTGMTAAHNLVSDYAMIFWKKVLMGRTHMEERQ